MAFTKERQQEIINRLKLANVQNQYQDFAQPTQTSSMSSFGLPSSSGSGGFDMNNMINMSADQLAKEIQRRNQLGQDTKELQKSYEIISRSKTNQTSQNPLVKAGNIAEKYFLKPLTETLVNPLAKALATPFVSGYKEVKSLVTGKQDYTPVETPFGEVKPFQAQTTGERIGTTAEVALSMIPAKKLVKPLKWTASKVLPSGTLTKVASFLTSVPKQKFETAKNMGKEKLVSAMKYVEEPENLPLLGEQIYKTAKTLKGKATKAWKVTEDKIISSIGPKFQPGLRKIRNEVTKTLAEEGIKLKGIKVNLKDTVFTGNKAAQEKLNRILSVVNEKSNNIQSLIRKRTALKDIVMEIPREQASLKRISTKILSSYDNTLNNLTKGKSETLRKSYAEMVDPANKFIKEVTTQGKFDADKSSRFIKQVMSDVKFNKAELLNNLDKVAGTKFLDDVKNMGVANALSKLTPETSGRIKDIVLGLGIAGHPILGALVSPKFWGMALTRSKVAKKSGQEFTDYVISIILQNVLKNTPKEIMK